MMRTAPAVPSGRRRMKSAQKRTNRRRPVDSRYRRFAMSSAEIARSGTARWDRFHGDDRAFYERVRDGYLRLAAGEPGRFVVVNGDRPEETVAADIRRQVDQLLGLPA